MPAPTTATLGASSRGRGSSPSAVATSPTPPHALQGVALPGGGGGRSRAPSSLRARFCALVRDTSMPSPAQRPHHIMPEPAPPAPASACASSPASGDAADAPAPDMAPRRVDARALGANRARGGTEPDARHVSARVSVAAERRCASAMSLRPRARHCDRSRCHPLLRASGVTIRSVAFHHARRSKKKPHGRRRACRTKVALHRSIRSIYALRFIIDPRTFAPPPPPLPW